MSNLWIKVAGASSLVRKVYSYNWFFWANFSSFLAKKKNWDLIKTAFPPGLISFLIFCFCGDNAHIFRLSAYGDTQI